MVCRLKALHGKNSAVLFIYAPIYTIYSLSLRERCRRSRRRGGIVVMVVITIEGYDARYAIKFSLPLFMRKKVAQKASGHLRLWPEPRNATNKVSLMLLLIKCGIAAH